MQAWHTVHVGLSHHASQWLAQYDNPDVPADANDVAAALWLSVRACSALHARGFHATNLQMRL